MEEIALLESQFVAISVLRGVIVESLDHFLRWYNGDSRFWTDRVLGLVTILPIGIVALERSADGLLDNTSLRQSHYFVEDLYKRPARGRDGRWGHSPSWLLHSDRCPSDAKLQEPHSTRERRRRRSAHKRCWMLLLDFYCSKKLDGDYRQVIAVNSGSRGTAQLRFVKIYAMVKTRHNKGGGGRRLATYRVHIDKDPAPSGTFHLFASDE